MQSSIELIWSFTLDYTRGWGVHRHQHDYLQLCYCLEGDALFHLNGEDFQIAEGDCMFIRPNQIHEVYPLEHGQCRVVDTKFYIHDPVLYHAVMGLPSIFHPQTPQFGELQQKMRMEWASQHPYSQELSTLYFEQALYLLLRERKDDHSASSFYHDIENEVDHLTGIEQQIAEYLAQHYLEDISLDRISEELRYSKNYLCKVFKAATGYTINEYCNFLRIRKAYDMVCCTDQKLSEIATQCAFSSIQYFSRTFRKYVGHSPSEIRDRDRNILDQDARLHDVFHHFYCQK